MGRPSKYSQEFRERAVRLVLEQRDEYPSEFDAIRSVAAKLGVGSPETLRKWLRRAEVDSGARPGLTTAWPCGRRETEARGVVGFEVVLGALRAAGDSGVITSIPAGVE